MTGAALGLVFASAFHLCFVGVAHATEVVLEGYGYGAVLRTESPFSSGRWRITLPAGPAQGVVLPWMEPFWAILSAALGQCLAVATWALPERPSRSYRNRRLQRHRRYAVAHSLMWLTVAVLVSVRLASVYIRAIFNDSLWVSIRNEPSVENPYAMLAPVAFRFVLFLVLVPWQGLSLSYRCRWWPALGVVAVPLVGGVLFLVGRWTFAGLA